MEGFEKFAGNITKLRMDRVRNENMARSAGIIKELASRVDQRVLTVERVD